MTLTRSEFISDLVETTLGPKFGVNEILEESMNPYFLYITGILSHEYSEPDFDSTPESGPEEFADEGDDQIPDDVGNPISYVSGLDSKARPISLGLSFIVRTQKKEVPFFNICITWARYLWKESIKKEEIINNINRCYFPSDTGDYFNGWQRDPRHLILENIKLAPNDEYYIIKSNEIKTKNFKYLNIGNHSFADDDFEVIFRSDLFLEETDKDFYRVSIYFRNNSIEKNANDDENQNDKKTGGEWVQNFIFQPQIRINLHESNNLVEYEFEKKQTNNDEEEITKLLYRNAKQYARGHMCSAIWKEIDPENNNDINKPTIKKIPFYWLDGELLSEGDFKAFYSPQLKTEYEPIFCINAPDFERFNAKILDPDEISENAFDCNYLDNLTDGITIPYKKWIEQQKNHISLNPNLKILEKNIQMHETIYERIVEAQKILNSDENARLAFCFANRAILQQYIWSKKYSNPSAKKFYWRTFQIAFLLLSIKGLIDKNATNPERDIVDLIWIPTGGGKTEAYLLVMAFLIAYRRRIAISGGPEIEYSLGNGTIIISRYTLRLLTIQQFRRAIKVITACDYLRVIAMDRLADNASSLIGWLPKSTQNYNIQKNSNSKWIWGSSRISLGLWVGGNLSPNNLMSIITKEFQIYNALDALKVTQRDNPKYSTDYIALASGDPAQILRCPVCDSILSLPKKKEDKLPCSKFILYLLISANETKLQLDTNLKLHINKNPQINENLKVELEDITEHKANLYILHLSLEVKSRDVNSRSFRDWWITLENTLKIKLIATDVLNSGYYFLYTNKKDKKTEYDFEIRCVNPKCDLYTTLWAEKIPLPDKKDEKWTEIKDEFQLLSNDMMISSGIPINAFTVDEQIYQRLPTLIIATIDKFARLIYKESAGGIFGNVDSFYSKHGFFRYDANYERSQKIGAITNLPPIDPPELILQDELHLIEGPLGSIVGIFEILIEELAKRYNNDKLRTKIKYIASTATIKSGKEQIKALYTRGLRIFPPPGIGYEDSYFIHFKKNNNIFDEKIPGRIYLGMIAPGKSTPTPFTRIWGSLLQSGYEKLKDLHSSGSFSQSDIDNLDKFWTIVGYFNAIRELAQVRALYHQDYVAWMRLFYGDGNFRNLNDKQEEPVELYSWTDSTLLPIFLKDLENSLTTEPYPQCQYNVNTGVLTTSMFGTGVDVSRLGLMVMNGQPKTTSSYIQATGRIGRSGGGLVVVFLHAGRPRDLDHYERFAGYHQSLYRFVEPITVMPFAPESARYILGPIIVGLLRQAIQVGTQKISSDWLKKGPEQINTLRPDPFMNDLIQEIIKIFKLRHEDQPIERQIDLDMLLLNLKNEITFWFNLIDANKELHYYEYTLTHKASKSVVLGTPQHEAAGKSNPEIKQIFKNAPNSLRGVEPTTTFGMRLD
jgi:hypothetical protein